MGNNWAFSPPQSPRYLPFNKMFRKTLILSLFVFLVSFSASAQSRDIL